MTFLDTLREAHIKQHRVGHVCDNLTAPEKLVFKRVKKEPGFKLTEDGMTALVEPRRYGVNWRQALLDMKGGKKKAEELVAKARADTADARKRFEEEGPDWSDETLEKIRLVIIG